MPSAISTNCKHMESMVLNITSLGRNKVRYVHRGIKLGPKIIWSLRPLWLGQGRGNYRGYIPPNPVPPTARHPSPILSLQCQAPPPPTLAAPPPPPRALDPRGNIPKATVPSTPCVTFCLVADSLWGGGQSAVLPFTCCIGLLLSVGRCSRCSCWCCFSVHGAQWLVCQGCAGCGMVCRLRVSGAQWLAY